MNKNILVLFVLTLALLALPLLGLGPYYLHVFIMIMMYIIMGTGWNVVGGMTGQVSFGHVAFFGISAYTSMLIMLKLGLNPLAAIVFSVLASIISAYGLGLVLFKLKGPYFGLGTLAVAEILKVLAINLEKITKGTEGLVLFKIPRFFGLQLTMANKLPFYYFILGMTVIILACAMLIWRSRWGYFFFSVREDEDAAGAMGLDTRRLKIVAYVISAAMVGLAGGFFSLYACFLDPEIAFELHVSAQMIFVAVVGGLGSLWGPVVGSVIVVFLSEYLRANFDPSLNLLVYGAFIVLTILFMPEGLVGFLERTLQNRRGKSERLSAGS